MAREYKINTPDYLQELGHSKFEIVKGEPDIRGWKVKNQQQQILGEVEELLFDAQARKVRYLILDLEGNVLDLEPRHVVVPIGLAQLHEQEDDVILPNVNAAQLQQLPVYDRDAFNPEIENNIHRVFSGEAAAGSQPYDYTHPQYDNSNLYRNRKAQTVIGLFPDASQAAQAQKELMANNFSGDNIEIAARHTVDPVNGYAPDKFDRFFASLFNTPAEAQAYGDSIQTSNAVLAVHTYSPQEAQRAARILDKYSPVDLNEPAGRQQYVAGTAQVGAPADAATIPVMEEKVEIGKKEVDAGGVRIQSRIVERPVEENLNLRQERVRIERVSVDRPVTDADLASFQEGAIELRERAEVPVVNKEARVVEEISFGKDVEEREETVRGTVRSTDVDVENLDKNRDDTRLSS